MHFCIFNAFLEQPFIHAAPTDCNKRDGRIRNLTNFNSVS